MLNKVGTHVNIGIAGGFGLIFLDYLAEAGDGGLFNFGILLIGYGFGVGLGAEMEKSREK